METLKQKYKEGKKNRTRNVEHLNLVLRTLRSVNQLIRTEKDLSILIQSTCDILTENHGFHSAWIATMDQSGAWHKVASAGFGKEFQILIGQIERGELPSCGLKALSGSKVIAIVNKHSNCSGCPLIEDDTIMDKGTMTVNLIHDDQTFGLLSVTTSKDLVANKDEQLLFKEVASDIALALFLIEQEKKSKETEKKRKQVEKQLMLTQFTMNNAADASFWIAPDARFRYINDTACRILGYSREELLSLTVYDIDPNFPKEFWPAHWNELKEKGSITLESSHQTKNGRVFPVEIKAHYLEYEGKEYNLAFASDITERKKAETALKISEERLRRFMESATDAFSIWDSELNLIDLNEAELKLYPRGTKKEELIGLSIREISQGIEKTDRYDKYRNVIKTGEPCFFEEFVPHERFGSLYLSARAFRVGDGMGLITTDVTERKMALKALRESEELNRSIIDTATDAFIGMDSCGLITDWNKQAEKIFGIPRKEAIGRSFAETVLIPDHRDMYISEIGSFMATGKHPFLKEHVELTAVHRNGNEFPVQIKVWPIKVGGEHRFNAFVEDISERMELQKLKDEFIYTASHELRTPLTTMKEGISQISEGLLGGITEKQNEFLDMIIDDIDRLTRIINDLLDMSRIDANTSQLNMESVDLSDLVKGICNVFNPRAEEKGLEIRTRLPRQKVKVHGDKDKILQIFTNLLGNAIKFTQNGHIEITLSSNGDYIECSITDTGKGIPENELPKIFDKFQQFGKFANPKEKGSGLGLYIVKRMVEMHHGEIRVESQPDEGSKFTITLPKK